MSGRPTPPPTPRPEVHAEAEHPTKFEKPAHVFNRGQSPQLFVLTGLFKDLSKAKPQKRREALAKWFHTWRTEVGNDLYPAMRLIVPQCDKDRAVYGLKEQALARIFTSVLGLDAKSSTALRLKNWKKPTNDEQKGAGDFPSVLYNCIQSRNTTTTTHITLDEVNDYLDALAANSKSNAQEAVLRQICARCNAEDQIWIVRIILKDLKISVKEGTVFSVFHPSAFDIYNSTSDLKQVCWKLYDPHSVMTDEDKEIQLFQPFQPMLCKRPRRELQDVVKLMESKEFIMEEKLDGERMQVHKRGNEYYYCSRNGKDYTYLYGQHIGTGALTPFIDSAFNEGVKSIILDGEMLVWDPSSERYLPFGWLKPAALNKSDDPTTMHPTFKVFDILYLNGRRLNSWPLHKRKETLTKCLTRVPNILELVLGERGKTTKDVRTVLERIMDEKGEGLVVKNPDKPYVLNGREDSWLKVKPEYIDEMAETVDVLVFGGNYGTGHRGGGVSTLICAVRDDSKTGDPVFLSFVRIGSGLSMSDFEDIRKKNWQPYTKGEDLDFVRLSPRGTEDKPDVYIRPEDSFVITVKAAEIVPSEKYAMEWTMRFPRCRTIRREADWHNCMTASEIHELRSGGKKRSATQDSGKPKRRKDNQGLVLPAAFTGTNVKDLPVESNLFQGMKFFILEGTRKYDKTTLEKLVHQHGGKFQQLLKGDDLIVVSSRLGFPKANAAVKKGLEILTPRWIVDCINDRRLCPRSAEYLTANNIEIQESSATEEEAQDEDDVEDGPQLPRTALVDEEEEPDSDPHEQIDETIDDLDDDVSMEHADRAAVEEDDERSDVGIQRESEAERAYATLPDESTDERIFSHLYFYLDTPSNAKKNGLTEPAEAKNSIMSKFEALEAPILENGGKLTSDIHDPSLTHIIIDRRDKSRTTELRTLTKSGNKYRQQVTPDFITDSIDDGALVSESVYRP